MSDDLIVEPADEWSSDFLEALGSWKEDIELPRSRPISRLKDPFE